MILNFFLWVVIPCVAAIWLNRPRKLYYVGAAGSPPVLPEFFTSKRQATKMREFYGEGVAVHTVEVS